MFRDSVASNNNNPRLVIAYEPPSAGGTLEKLPESMLHTHDLSEVLGKIKRRAVELRRRGLDAKSPTLELVVVVATATDAKALVQFVGSARHYNVRVTAVVVVGGQKGAERVCGIVLGPQARAQGISRVAVCLPPFPDTKSFIRTLQTCVPRALPHDVVARAGGVGPSARVVAFDMENGGKVQVVVSAREREQEKE